MVVLQGHLRSVSSFVAWKTPRGVWREVWREAWRGASASTHATTTDTNAARLSRPDPHLRPHVHGPAWHEPHRCCCQAGAQAAPVELEGVAIEQTALARGDGDCVLGGMGAGAA